MEIGDMKIYVVNLGKYNEGAATGRWFNVPVSVEELKEELGLKGEHEEYAIHDYELPFEIGEYESIEEINRRCRMLEDVPQELFGDLKEIINGLFNGDVDEMLKNIEDVNFYDGMESMEDLARYFVEECGEFGEIPDKLINYIDYEAIGRDLEIEGFYLLTSNGIYGYNC